MRLQNEYEIIKSSLGRNLNRLGSGVRGAGRSILGLVERIAFNEKTELQARGVEIKSYSKIMHVYEQRDLQQETTIRFPVEFAKANYKIYNDS